VAWEDDGWGDSGDFYDSRDQPDVKDILFGNVSTQDMRAQELFVQAFFDGDDKAYVDLVDYMYTQYGIDFEQAFEWQDFKEWYDSQ
jgi:hypothetical protein